MSLPFSQEIFSSDFPVLSVHVLFLIRAVQRFLCIKDMNLSCGCCHETSEMGGDESCHDSTRASGQLTFLSPFHTEVWIYVVKGATKKCFNLNYLAQRITMSLSITWVMARIWLTKCIMHQPAPRHLSGRNVGSFHGNWAGERKAWDFTVAGEIYPMRNEKGQEHQGAGTGPLITRDPGRSWAMILLPNKWLFQGPGLSQGSEQSSPFPLTFHCIPNIKVNLSAAISPHGFLVLPAVSKENSAFMA